MVQKDCGIVHAPMRVLAIPTHLDGPETRLMGDDTRFVECLVLGVCLLVDCRSIGRMLSPSDAEGPEDPRAFFFSLGDSV